MPLTDEQIALREFNKMCETKIPDELEQSWQDGCRIDNGAYYNANNLAVFRWIVSKKVEPLEDIWMFVAAREGSVVIAEVILAQYPDFNLQSLGPNTCDQLDRPLIEFAVRRAGWCDIIYEAVMRVRNRPDFGEGKYKDILQWAAEAAGTKRIENDHVATGCLF